MYRIISIIVCTFFIAGNLWANLDKQIKAVLKEHVAYHKKHNGEGNYFIYFSPEYATSPTTVLTTDDWLKEDPVGIMPLATELEADLLLKNTAVYEDKSIGYTGRLQHYVMVIDLTYYNKTKWEVLVESLAETFGFSGATKSEEFAGLANTRLGQEFSTFKISEIFDANAKFLVTFAFINKVVVDNIVKAEVRLSYGVSSNTYQPVNHYCDTARIRFNLEKESVTTKGLNIIIRDVYFFNEILWKDPTKRLDCLDLIGEVSSTIAGTFITQRCSLAGENVQNKFALLRSAQFIELLKFCKDNSVDPVLTNDIIGNIEVSYFDWLDRFLEPYFAISEAKPDYGEWLEANYDTYFPPTEIMNNYHAVYFSYFFEMDPPKYTSLQQIFIKMLHHYSGIYDTPLDHILGHDNPIGNLAFNKVFNDMFKWLYNSDCTQAQRQGIYNYILTYPEIESILYNCVLNPGPSANEIPGLGPSSLEIARSMVPLFIEFGPTALPAYDAAHTIPVKYNEALFTTRSLYSGNYGGYPVVEKYSSNAETEFNENSTKVNFKIWMCRAHCVYNPIETCICVEEFGHFNREVNFFDMIYAIQINQPGYRNHCQENATTSCSNLISLEPAFFTATKIRQHNTDEIVTNVSSQIAIVTLPFSLAEVTAPGLMLGIRALHGIWLTSDVVSLIDDQGGLTSTCKKIFGEVKGESVASKISHINGIVQLTSLASPIIGSAGSNKYLTTIEPEQSLDGAAVDRYLRDYVIDNAEDFPEVEAADFAETGRQLGADEVGSLGAEAEGLIRDKYAALYGFGPTTEYILSIQKAKIRELINRCRHKLNSFEMPPANQRRVHEVIGDMSPEVHDLLIADLSGSFSTQLFQFFEGATFSKNLEQRLMAWFALRQTPKRLDLKWLHLTTRAIEKEVEVISNGAEVIFKKSGVQVAESVDGILHVDYNYFGGDIIGDLEKTVTGLGKLTDEIDQGGTSVLIANGISFSGENPKGLNLLSFNDAGMSLEQKWAINLAWLNEAINRGDIIRAISNPLRKENIFFDYSNISDVHFTDPDALYDFMLNLTIQQESQLGFYGKEVRRLSQAGYKFKVSSKLFEL